MGFWQWYSFSELDNGQVQIQVHDGAWGAWEAVSGLFEWTSGGWTYFWIDLTQYGNLTARLGFDFHSRQNGGAPDVSSGWYIDDIESNVVPSLLPTFLQSYSATTGINWVDIDWRVVATGERLIFEIYRKNVSDSKMVELSPAGFSNDGLLFRYRDQAFG